MSEPHEVLKLNTTHKGQSLTKHRCLKSRCSAWEGFPTPEGWLTAPGLRCGLGERVDTGQPATRNLIKQPARAQLTSCTVVLDWGSETKLLNREK